MLETFVPSLYEPTILFAGTEEMGSSQDEQRDFLALDIECTEFTTLENGTHYSSGRSNADSCQVANLMDVACNGQDHGPSAQTLAIVSPDGPTQTTDEPMQTTATKEPTRRLRPLSGPAPQPKRFFRRCWRGLSMRAVSREQLKSCMVE